MTWDQTNGSKHTLYNNLETSEIIYDGWTEFDANILPDENKSNRHILLTIL